jgi:hypothetical protein
MLQRVLLLGVFCQLGLALLSSLAVAAEAKFKIKVTVKVSGSDTKETYTIVPEKNYQLSLNKADTGRSKIALYDKKGNKKEGLYWIDNKDLAKIMNKPVNDIVKMVENRPAKPKPVCASCGTDDAQDHREPVAEPKPEVSTVVKPANKPLVVSDLPPPAPAAGDLCSKFEAFKKLGVPEAPLKQAMFYYNQHPEKFSKKQVISIADYSQRSDKKRFYMLDLDSRTVVSEKVSHGSGKVGGTAVSDPNNDGIVDRCEHPNRVIAAKKSGRNLKTRENMTRPGFFSTGPLNFSPRHKRKWPRITNGTNSLILNGLSGRVNETAKADGVYMHEAYYNFNGPQKMGKSFGCPAFVPGHGAPIFKKIMGGSLYYSYVPVCKSDMDYVLKDAGGWENFCAAK